MLWKAWLFFKEKGYNVFSKFESVLAQCMKFSSIVSLINHVPSPGGWVGFQKATPHIALTQSFSPSPTDCLGIKFQKVLLAKTSL